MVLNPHASERNECFDIVGLLTAGGKFLAAITPTANPIVMSWGTARGTLWLRGVEMPTNRSFRIATGDMSDLNDHFAANPDVLTRDIARAEGALNAIAGSARLQWHNTVGHCRARISCHGIQVIDPVRLTCHDCSIAIERASDPGFVYILTDGHLFKIGRSKDVAARVRSMRTGSPSLELVGSIGTTNMRDTEKLLHQRFAARRVKGEWFALSVGEVSALLAEWAA